MRLAQDPQYSRLPSGGWTQNGPVQYWLGRDHFLLVEVVWFVEKYRRFDLKDVEALIIRPTAWRAWGSGALLVLTLLLLTLCAGFFWANRKDFEAFPELLLGGGILVVTLVLLSSLVTFFFRGPTSQVRLTTSVQSINLPGLSRQKAARQFRDQVLSAARAMATSHS